MQLLYFTLTSIKCVVELRRIGEKSLHRHNLGGDDCIERIKIEEGLRMCQSGFPEGRLQEAGEGRLTVLIPLVNGCISQGSIGEVKKKSRGRVG